MLNDADVSRFRHVYVFVGRTDLRKGISGLSTLVKEKFHLDPFEPGNLFLLILSILVDTFFSRISLTMLPVPNPHNTSCVLS